MIFLNFNKVLYLFTFQVVEQKNKGNFLYIIMVYIWFLCLSGVSVCEASLCVVSFLYLTGHIASLLHHL